MSGRVYIEAIGASAPGFSDWPALRERLVGGEWEHDPNWAPVARCLSPRQAKRLSLQICLALSAAEMIVGGLAENAAWVFASSIGEGQTLHEILSALCEDEILIQPTKFQNSVHNAALGQWSIAAKETGPATSIAAFDHTVGAGILKAVMQVGLEQRPVGVVLFDAPLPPPLDEKRPLGVPMTFALALSPANSDNTIAQIDWRIASASPSEPKTSAGRALKRTGNPIAAALPLLEAVAQGGGACALDTGGACRLELNATVR